MALTGQGEVEEPGTPEVLAVLEELAVFEELDVLEVPDVLEVLDVLETGFLDGSVVVVADLSRF